MHEQEAYRNLRHNVKINTIQGIYSVMANNLIIPFIPLFAIKVLEASDSQVAWLSSLPALTGILVLLPGAFFIDRLAAKKHFTGVLIYAQRVFCLLIALLPFLPLSTYALAWLLVTLMALMNAPTSLSLLAWQAFIGDVIPSRQRARVFGMRNRVTQGVGLFTTVLTGFLIAQFSESGTWAYQIMFALACGVGMLEAWYLYKIIEPSPLIRIDRHSLSDSLRAVLREKRFLIFCSASAVFHFGWQMAWPLFNIYQVSPQYANMSAAWVSIITVVNALGSVLTYRMWGRVADRIGHGWTLCIGTLGIATAPLLYALSLNLYMLAIFNLSMGIFVACTVQTLFNRVLEVSPLENRAFFIAMHSLVIGITAIFAPQVGVWVMSISSMDTAFVWSSSVRLLGTFALAGVVIWERRRINGSVQSQKTSSF